MKLLLGYFFYPPVYSCLLDADIFLGTLFRNTRILCFSLRVTPIQNDSKIITQTCIFGYLRFWIEYWMTKRSELTDSKHLRSLICRQQNNIKYRNLQNPSGTQTYEHKDPAVKIVGGLHRGSSLCNTMCFYFIIMASSSQSVLNLCNNRLLL